MNDTYEAACAILRGFPELGSQFEGLTPGEIVAVFSRTERRDPLGVVHHEGLQPLRKPTRHPLCRCTSPVEFCNCAGAKYDLPDAEREAELIRQAARFGL